MLGGYLAESGEGTQAGFIFIAIDISKFRPIATFKKNIDGVIRTIKNSKKRPGVTEILVAGEPEFNTREKRLGEGIYVTKQTWTDIQEAANKLGVTLDAWNESIRA